MNESGTSSRYVFQLITKFLGPLCIGQFEREWIIRPVFRSQEEDEEPFFENRSFVMRIVERQQSLQIRN